jgi:hypothetical protein
MSTSPGETIKARLEPALAASITLVIGVWGDSAAPNPFTLHRLRTTPEVAQDFRSSGLRHIEHIAKNEVIDFDAGHLPDEGETMELPIGQFEYPHFVNAVFDPNLPAFDPEAEDIAFHCFAVHDGATRAAFLRQVSGVRLAKRNLIATLLTGDRVESLESEVLTFSPGVDLVIEPQTLWVSNAAAFRSLFRGASALATAIGSQVAAVARAVPIANIADFEQACRDDPRMMAKLARVASKPHLSLLTPPVLRRVIKEYHLPGDLLTHDGKLVHANSPQRRWMILRILDDAYVQSLATKMRYAANSKRQV